MRGLDPGDDPEHADQQSDRRAGPASHARVGRRRQPERRQRHEAADEMIAGRGARLRLEERVVDHVQRDHPDRNEEDPVLEPPGTISRHPMPP